MKSDKSFEWLSLCPEEFRNKVKEIFEHPPGTPEGARYFNYSESFLSTDNPFTEGSDIESENKRSEERRKFAKAWGTYAEAITARHIVKQGLPIREWNWRPPGKRKGEIDLITQRGNRIIFVEVKARDGKNSDPWEAITTSKIRDLCHGANAYLKMQREEYEYQFDIALLTGKYDDYVFEYIEDAFMCPLKVRN